jgi:hypothetical protein
MARKSRDNPGRTTRRPRRPSVWAARVGLAAQQPDQVGFQGPEAVQLGADLGQALAQQGLGVAAGALASLGDLEQLADLPQPWASCSLAGRSRPG